jgi:hypothetical protein
MSKLANGEAIWFAAIFLAIKGVQEVAAAEHHGATINDLVKIRIRYSVTLSYRCRRQLVYTFRVSHPCASLVFWDDGWVLITAPN